MTASDDPGTRSSESPAELHLSSLSPEAVRTLLFPAFAEDSTKALPVLGRGTPAAPGCAAGMLTLRPEALSKRLARGDPIVYWGSALTREDASVFDSVCAVISAGGGAAAHVSQIARSFGTPYVAGINAREDAHGLTCGQTHVSDGEWLSVDAYTGVVYVGKALPAHDAPRDAVLAAIAREDRYRRLKISAQAVTPKQIASALAWGADEIGVCRAEQILWDRTSLGLFRNLMLHALATRPETDHMRFDRAGVVARIGDTAGVHFQDVVTYHTLLQELKQRYFEKYMEVFSHLRGHACTLRLLDAPLQEYLPSDMDALRRAATELGIQEETLEHEAQAYKMSDCVLQLRGSRLLLAFPELVEIQVVAALAAAQRVQPSILRLQVPFVTFPREFQVLERQIRGLVANEVVEPMKRECIKVGCSIETPSAVLLAQKLIGKADFFFVGHCDLTQLTCAVSRNEGAHVIRDYVRRGIIDGDPFEYLRETGVARLLAFLARRVHSSPMPPEVFMSGHTSTAVRLASRLGFTGVFCEPPDTAVTRWMAARSDSLRAAPKSHVRKGGTA